MSDALWSNVSEGVSFAVAALVGWFVIIGLIRLVGWVVSAISKGRRRARLASLAAILALGLVVVIGLSGCDIKLGTSEMKVPDLAGTTPDAAEKRVGKDFRIDASESDVSSEPIGTIISQKPAPGERVSQGSTISVVTSAGQPPNPGDIFADDFSDNSFSNDIGGWNLGEYNKGGAEYADGGLRMYDAPSSLIHDSLVNNVGNVEDAIVEVDAKRTGDTLGWKRSSAWGVFCHQTDSGFGGYSLGIFGDGYAEIVKYDEKNGEYNRLAYDNYSAAIREGSATNHLRADCVGNKLTLYVNGEEVVEAKDGEFESGEVGLFVSYVANKGPGVEVLFDNFMASTPP